MSGKNLIVLLIKIAGLSIFNAFALWSVLVLQGNGNTSLALVMGALVILIDLIVFSSRAYPYRYMIPAMFLLFILTLYPMYFTFRTAFTNYGTGHIFTRPQAIQRLLADYFYTPEDPVDYEFSIFVKLKDFRPTDDFVVMFSRSTDGKTYFAPRPKAVSRDSQGNITLAVGNMSPVNDDTVSIDGIDYIIEKGKDSDQILSVASADVRYVYFYSPKDASTKPNAPFYFTDIRGIWLRNAEFVNTAGNQIRFSPQTLFTTFATIERQYGIKSIMELINGRPVRREIIYNLQTGRQLVEKDGVFYDIDPTGKEIKTEGYISNVGFKNILRIFEDPKVTGPFVQVFLWTFVWAGLSVLFTFAIGLVLAIVLNDEKLRGKKIYRTLLIIPWAIPSFISALVWRNGLFNETYGIINRFVIMGLFGAKEPIKWLSDPNWAKVAVIILNTWLGFPYMMTVSLGALQSIPGDLYEAASIDGARPWQRFRKITFPLLMVALAPLLVGSFAFNFNNFVGIYLLTQGGPAIPGSSTPAGSTDILISYTYKLAFEGRGQDFAFASAISILIFFIIAGFSWINFKVSGSFEEVSR